jgi:hypothetical protein
LHSSSWLHLERQFIACRCFIYLSLHQVDSLNTSLVSADDGTYLRKLKKRDTSYTNAWRALRNARKNVTWMQMEGHFAKMECFLELPSRMLWWSKQCSCTASCEASTTASCEVEALMECKVQCD